MDMPKRPNNLRRCRLSTSDLRGRLLCGLDELDIALEELVACPKCGHKQRANVYLFFGLLTAKGVRVVLGVIIGAMLAFAIWWGFLRG